ncbi:homocysteine S-methyltransferase family protein [Thaumasiovibrio subtropicus]|uniref:homocysteine S-methyltransferase family protein n=1 Tax=Thaumasiovibrio subtropicus TaxID=1891207 RepID=UPI000B361AAB|nr:homocysteine S-methyltransferase family protein [Thaumasiovibrio subtropicus]
MKKLTVLDGGMGRELKAMGAPFSQPLWSAQALLESPEYVLQAHRHFIDAGAEIIITNAYACVPFHLGDLRYQQAGFSLASLAAKLARQAVDQRLNEAKGTQALPCVAGTIPPAFGSYRPDLFKPDEAKDIYQTLCDAQRPYVDLWIAETIASIKELEVIQSVLAGCDKPRHFAFTLNDEVCGPARLRSGESVEEAVRAVLTQEASGVMFNCSVPEVMDSAISQARHVFTTQGKFLHIGVYANNFTPIEPDHEANNALIEDRELSPEDYLQYVARWYDLGADIIGGCCGISPAHIKAIADWKRSE